jgi:flagellar assembly protein FliH
MTSSSKPASTYARFIPREELQGFSAWQPGALGGGAAAEASGHQASAPAGARKPERAASAEQIDAVVRAARQAGYQDGYRDGLVALDGFKQSFAQQMTARLNVLVTSFDAQLDALEREMAAAVARTATELARQVVRSELAARPELVAKIAQDAIEAVLHSARHIRVSVHPDDHPLVGQGAGEALSSRGARLVASDAVARGGVMVESDVGSIDARIGTRWAQAAAVLGQGLPFEEPAT